MGASVQEQVVRFYRDKIPPFACVPGCHDCCGPVPASSWERAQLPAVPKLTRLAALAHLDCPHLGPQGCTVYDQRPLLCRIFGTVESLPCPHGRRPAKMLPAHVEGEINRFFQAKRHELI